MRKERKRARGAGRAGEAALQAAVSRVALGSQVIAAGAACVSLPQCIGINGQRLLHTIESHQEHRHETLKNSHRQMLNKSTWASTAHEAQRAEEIGRGTFCFQGQGLGSFSIEKNKGGHSLAFSCQKTQMMTKEYYLFAISCTKPPTFYP